MTDVYMSWSLAMSEDSESIAGNYVQPGSFMVEDTQHLLVVNLFRVSYKDVPIVRGDVFMASVSGVFVLFSTAVDAYLSIHTEVNKHVKLALGRDTQLVLEELLSSLPVLEGEPHLCAFISIIDSNNSLKRFWCWERVHVLVDSAPVISTGICPTHEIFAFFVFS
ncbi:hypothetical protein B0H14DRAFT_3485400 [Mycena olivaceomarginata]|nr:hypothetical protein B0H14DRAFT_3485400 [Mycena olivaceomarginata]